MRVAAPIANIALAFQRRHEALQQDHIESFLNRDPSAICQFHPKAARSRRQRAHQLDRQQPRDARLRSILMLVPIVVQGVKRYASFPAKRLPRHATLFELHQQPLCFLATTTTTHCYCTRFSHAPSSTQSMRRQKNGLARTHTNSPHSSFSSAFALDLRQQAIHVAARDLLRMIYLADMDYPCSYTVRTGIPRRLFRIEVWRGASSNK